MLECSKISLIQNSKRECLIIGYLIAIILVANNVDIGKDDDDDMIKKWVGIKFNNPSNDVEAGAEYNRRCRLERNQLRTYLAAVRAPMCCFFIVFGVISNSFPNLRFF